MHSLAGAVSCLFSLLRAVQTFGPVTQSEFLQRMGIEHRINQVLEACESTAP